MTHLEITEAFIEYFRNHLNQTFQMFILYSIELNYREWQEA